MSIIERSAEPGCGCDAAQGLASIDQALARLQTLPRPLRPPKNLPLRKAKGRILAAPITARANVPDFASSAMDGYAVASADLTGTGPWRLPVRARIAAGDAPAARLAPGTAARIFTGAALPAGADAVIMQEAVQQQNGGIQITEAPRPGAHTRPIADDLRAGATVLAAGTRLGPRQIAAAAAAGRATVPVAPRLRVALLITGSEVREAGQPLGPGQIWDINCPMMAALVQRPEIRVTRIARAADDAGSLQAQIADLAAGADLLVTSGGISVGETDLVKPVLLALGGQITLSGVAIKPGKPVSYGRLGQTAWLGLPGNPVSAYVIWQVFGAALCDHLTGHRSGQFRRHVVLETGLSHHPGRCELRPAALAGHDPQGREIARFQGRTHSARVNSLTAADGLILIPGDTDHLQSGDLVEFLPFDLP